MTRFPTVIFILLCVAAISCGEPPVPYPAVAGWQAVGNGWLYYYDDLALQDKDQMPRKAYHPVHGYFEPRGYWTQGENGKVVRVQWKKTGEAKGPAIIEKPLFSPASGHPIPGEFPKGFTIETGGRKFSQDKCCCDPCECGKDCQCGEKRIKPIPKEMPPPID